MANNIDILAERARLHDENNWLPVLGLNAEQAKEYTYCWLVEFAYPVPQDHGAPALCRLAYKEKQIALRK